MAFAVIPRKRLSNSLMGMHDANRLFDEFFGGASRSPSFGAGDQRRSFVPSIDVVETDEVYRVTAELPGLSEEDFSVEVEDGILTLKGEKRGREETETEGVRRSETHYGKFERRIRFREPVSEDAVAASYRDGVLTVTLPRPEEPQPAVRQVPVETG